MANPCARYCLNLYNVALSSLNHGLLHSFQSMRLISRMLIVHILSWRYPCIFSFPEPDKSEIWHLNSFYTLTTQRNSPLSYGFKIALWPMYLYRYAPMLLKWWVTVAKDFLFLCWNLALFGTNRKIKAVIFPSGDWRVISYCDITSLYDGRFCLFRLSALQLRNIIW